MRLWVAEGVEHIGLCEQAGFDAVVHERANLAWQQRLDLQDAWQADAFVQRHLRHRLFEVRGLLARQTLLIHRLSDEQVLRQVANELQFGTLRADLYAWRPQVITRAAEAVVVVAAPVAKVAPQPERVEAQVPTPEPAVAPAPVSEAPVAAPSAEVVALQDAMAATLELAAQDGTALCEVCEQAKAQPPAEPSPREVLQAAQAATLEKAAESGTPFCEVCEQASNPASTAPTALQSAQGAQAVALEAAAQNGTPFCEICEGNS